MPDMNETRDIDITFHDFLRTGPDTIAGRYLRSFWQPVYRGVDLLKGKAKPVRIMSEDFTLFRGEDGIARMLEARCAHRGAKLSVGWVEGNDIKCAYHGWAYDGKGQCVKQPAEPRPFCDKVKVRAYPIEEYLGLIFAYLGDGEPPVFERFPEFENSAYVTLLTTGTWNANYWAQLENSIDYAHTEFLHWHFHFKTPQRVNVDQTEFGIRVSVPGLSGGLSAYDTMIFTMPNTHEWAVPPLNGEKVGAFARSWRIPRDDESHIRFDLRIYPLKAEEAEAFKKRGEALGMTQQVGQVPAIAQSIIDGTTDFAAIKENRSIGGGQLVQVQDCTVMTSLGPMATREHKEMLGQTDVAIALLRRLWKQELQAFAAGRPLQQWKRPDRLWAEMTDAPASGN